MKLGKLDNETLDRLILRKFKHTRQESSSAPRIGMDCALLDFQDDFIVASCDPITSADWMHIGSLSVHVNCNDAAAGGADPVGLLVTLLLPPTATSEMIDRISDDLQQAAEQAGVDIIGGHTEVTDAVTRVTTCSTVIARQSKAASLVGARPGDSIVMTKWAGLEGTYLIASDFSDRLRTVDSDIVRSAQQLNTYLSVVPESRIALKNGAHAMHDVTEGGVFGAIWELAAQTGCGAILDRSSIPVLKETEAITNHLKIDPYRLMSSGSMLIACPNAGKMIEALQNAGIQASEIGKITTTGFFSPFSMLKISRASCAYHPICVIIHICGG